MRRETNSFWTIDLYGAWWNGRCVISSDDFINRDKGKQTATGRRFKFGKKAWAVFESPSVPDGSELNHWAWYNGVRLCTTYTKGEG